MSAMRLAERRRGLPSHPTRLNLTREAGESSRYLPLPPCRPGAPGTPPSSSLDRLGSPWFELPGSQPSGPLPTPWLQWVRWPLPPPPVCPQVEMVLVSIVTAPVSAMARPSRVAPVVMVMLMFARMLPANAVVVPSVAELPTCQNTFNDASQG